MASGRYDGEACQHARADLFIVLKCEDEIRPAVTLERPMRTGLPLDLPANPNDGGQYSAALRRWPVVRAARNVTLAARQLMDRPADDFPDASESVTVDT